MVNLYHQEWLMKIIILISSLLLVSCATHRVTLGDMVIIGSNDQEIPEPTRRWDI